MQSEGEFATELAAWIKEKTELAGCEGVVFGLSGGIDSAVVAGVAVKAWGENALGIIMPCDSLPSDAIDAQVVADAFSLKTETIPLENVFGSIEAATGKLEGMARANIKARLRMSVLYARANSLNYLVLGTGNKTELHIGYFTKYGDGGSDLLPLGSLYKHEVNSLAINLGVPEAVITKAPSAGLYEGQTDEAEIGLSYPRLDAALKAILEGSDNSDISSDNIPPEDIALVKKRMATSEHKRVTPPIFTL